MQKQSRKVFVRMGTVLLGAALAGAAWGQKAISGQGLAAESAPSGPQGSATAATRPAGKRMALNPPPFRPLGSITVSGSLRMRAEAWHWFAGEAENTYGFFDSILRLRVGQQKTGWGWQIEVAQPTALGPPDHAIAAGTQGALGWSGAYDSANSYRRNGWGLFSRKAFVGGKGLGGNDANTSRLGRFKFLDRAEVAPRNPTWATCLYFGRTWAKGEMQSLYSNNLNAMFGYSELTLKF